jgi:uncharacterized membrane protein
LRCADEMTPAYAAARGRPSRSRSPSVSPRPLDSSLVDRSQRLSGSRGGGSGGCLKGGLPPAGHPRRVRSCAMTHRPTPDTDPTALPLTPTRRAAITSSIGFGVAAVAASFMAWQTAPLVGWAVAALLWSLSTWFAVLRLDADSTSAFATRVEPRRAATDLLLITAAVGSLIAVVLGVIKAGTVSGYEKEVLLVAGVFSIVASWGVVHTVFALRYAALYYTGPDGGIDFNDEGKPTYADFAYLAFTIGMTYQVSDTNLTAKAIRHTALRHALLSFLFGTVIIAATINIAAGLAK